jgi:hypothetical protein
MSKSTSIFSSEYAIGLAQDMAESRSVLGPSETFRRLLSFAGIGALALVALIVSVCLLNSAMAIDPNSRTLLLFLSLAATLVLVATIGASLLFLWDSFLGQYVQRLALMDDAVDATLEDDVAEIPVIRQEDLAGAFDGSMQSPILDVSVRVHDETWVRDGDVSAGAIKDQLIALKAVTPTAEWENLDFERHLQFFEGLERSATVKTAFTATGQAIISCALPPLANPVFVYKAFGLASLSGLLDKIPGTLRADREEETDAMRPNVA